MAVAGAVVAAARAAVLAVEGGEGALWVGEARVVASGVWAAAAKAVAVAAAAAAREAAEISDRNRRSRAPEGR